MEKNQSGSNYSISGKALKAAGGGIYEDQFQNKIEFSSDIEDDIEIHLVGSGNYVKLGKITSVNEYKIPEKLNDAQNLAGGTCHAGHDRRYLQKA